MLTYFCIQKNALLNLTSPPKYSSPFINVLESLKTGAYQYFPFPLFLSYIFSRTENRCFSQLYFLPLLISANAKY